MYDSYLRPNIIPIDAIKGIDMFIQHERKLNFKNNGKLVVHVSSHYIGSLEKFQIIRLSLTQCIDNFKAN